MKLYVNLEAPYEWVRVNGLKVEAYGEVPSLSEYPISEEDDLVGVVPGSYVTVHTVTSPARTRKQFLAALPYSLEESVSEDVEDLYFVPLNWRVNQATKVLVIARSKMSEWQDLANQHKLPLQRLIPDYDLLPLHQVAECTMALKQDADNRVLLVRSRDGDGLSIDADFIEQWLMTMPESTTIAVADEPLVEQLRQQFSDRDFRYWDFGDRTAHWLELPNDSKLDLLGNEYRPKVKRIGKQSFLLPVVLLIGAIGLMLLFNVYRYFSFHAEIKNIDAEQQRIIVEKLPDLAGVSKGKERYMMEQAILRQQDGEQPASFVELLATAAKVLRRQKVTLSEVSYRNSQMVLSCNLRDLSQVDMINRLLNQNSRMSSRLESSSSDDGKVTANYLLQVK